MLFASFLNKVQNRHFDLALQMQGNGTIVNEFLPVFEAKQVAGFYAPNRPVDSGLFLEYPLIISEIHRHLLLMKHLGIPSQGEYLEFPVTKKDEEDFKSSLLPITDKKYVVIHPGARGTSA